MNRFIKLLLKKAIDQEALKIIDDMVMAIDQEALKIIDDMVMANAKVASMIASIANYDGPELATDGKKSVKVSKQALEAWYKYVAMQDMRSYQLGIVGDHDTIVKYVCKAEHWRMKFWNMVRDEHPDLRKFTLTLDDNLGIVVFDPKENDKKEKSNNES
jgi:hypothetical protein